MQVAVHYWAQARLAAGTETDILEFAEAPTVREVLLRAAREHGAELTRFLLTGDGQPQPALLLFVGEEQVRGDADRRLQPGELLAILPPMAGG